MYNLFYMGRIKQLDAQTANMIAAGEVVERPMGVVKELIENAIDAGSTRIEVIVEEGGLKKITVIDNGSGMDSNDAVLAFERHATSKISNTSDLWNIGTLGFRGEALPSIASVSKFTLKTSDGNDATRVIVEYGKIISVENYPCNRGTEVSVENLFYKTPARLKHMRSSAYENSLVQDVVNRFALSHPEIAFIFKSGERESLRTTGQNNLLEVIFQVWGRDASENAIPVSFNDYDYQVKGYIIKPNITRASRNYINVFLNGRMVRTYRIYKAIQDGYEDFIVKGRYPLAVLNIEMDNQLLDVNVHPSKWEVRLSKEKQLEELVTYNISKALKESLLAPSVKIVEDTQTYFTPLSFEKELTFNTIQESKPPVYQEEIHKEEKPIIQEEVKENRSFPDMEVIGQLHRKFILCACPEGLAIFDQHASQERVHYEEIKNSLNTNPSMMECLVPISIPTTDDIVQRVDEINESIKDLHVTFEPFGHDTLLVREIPLWMQEVEEVPFLTDVLDQFKQGDKTTYARMEKKKIATMACHHSIRFNRTLTRQEMEEVVNQLRQCENPYHCPHGRPTFVILDEYELTKEFLR